MAPPFLTSNPESLVVWRRRKEYNQTQAAAEFGVHVDRYRAWEAGRGEPIPRRLLGQLRTHEKCFLMRRRRGLTQKALARLMGCTRLWVIQMEDGKAPADRLKQYWKV